MLNRIFLIILSSILLLFGSMCFYIFIFESNFNIFAFIVGSTLFVLASKLLRYLFSIEFAFSPVNFQYRVLFNEDELLPNEKLIYNVQFKQPVIKINPDNKEIVIIDTKFNKHKLTFDDIASYSISMNENLTVQKTFLNAITTPAISSVGSTQIKRIDRVEVTINTNNFEIPFVTCYLYFGKKITEKHLLYDEIQQQIKTVISCLNIIENIK